ncbi:hypothetical protein DFJ73DRAFT_297017 [Zopfochytrium polystomum]|nr:hypothetical protein DFJ73DRAFT_297017 [Zopfochytrium polystomum]
MMPISDCDSLDDDVLPAPAAGGDDDDRNLCQDTTAASPLATQPHKSHNDMLSPLAPPSSSSGLPSLSSTVPLVGGAVPSITSAASAPDSPNSCLSSSTPLLALPTTAARPVPPPPTTASAASLASLFASDPSCSPVSARSSSLSPSHPEWGAWPALVVSHASDEEDDEPFISYKDCSAQPPLPPLAPLPPSDGLNVFTTVGDLTRVSQEGANLSRVAALVDWFKRTTETASPSAPGGANHLWPLMDATRQISLEATSAPRRTGRAASHSSAASATPRIQPFAAAASLPSKYSPVPRFPPTHRNQGSRTCAKTHPLTSALLDSAAAAVDVAQRKLSRPADDCLHQQTPPVKRRRKTQSASAASEASQITRASPSQSPRRSITPPAVDASQETAQWIAAGEEELNESALVAAVSDRGVIEEPPRKRCESEMDSDVVSSDRLLVVAADGSGGGPARTAQGDGCRRRRLSSRSQNGGKAAARAADATKGSDDGLGQGEEGADDDAAEKAEHQEARAREEGFDLSDPSQRRRWLLLERNRRAAQKCRHRRKARMDVLRESVDTLSEQNSQLMEQATALREHVLHLKSLLLANRDCPVALLNGIDIPAIEATLTTTLKSIY